MVSWGRASLGMLAAVTAVVMLLALGGWAYHHFVVALRLPQERSITMQGKSIQVRLEACNDVVVKYTVLADGSTHYAAIARLGEADQDLFRQLPKGLVLKYPLEMPLDQGDGQPVPARIEGHTADWVKYTLLADDSTHYLPMVALTPNDQTVVQQLPAYLTAEYPVLHTMTDMQGQFLPSRIEGRSRNLAKLSTTDGAITYFPISALSAVDQKLMDLLPDNFNFYCPVECTLATQQGQKLSVRVEGRSANLIKYTLLSDGLVYYVPTAKFSILDQQVLRELPSNMVLSFPIEYTISDTIGRPMRVRLEGRNANLVKFTSLTDGLIHYAPLASFSPEDQDFLQLLPADLVIDFPLNYTLIALGGQPLEAHILGRDADSVKFQLADGKTYNYRLDLLADSSQAFLRMLPANLVDASVPAPPPPPASPAQSRFARPPDPPSTQADLTTQRNALAGLVAANQKIQSALNQMRGGSGVVTQHITSTGGIIATNGANGPVSTGLIDGRSYSRNQLFAMIETNADGIDTACTQINNDLAKLPGGGSHTIVQSMWEQAMETVKRGSQIRRDIANAGPSEAQALQGELLSNQKNLVDLLTSIYSQSGQYSP